MAKATLQFGEWRPDVALLDNQFAAIAENVFPAANSYLPFPGLTNLTTTALPGTCVGLTFCRNAAGAFVIFAGTATRLYKWDGSAWDDVTRTSGGVAPNHDYNVTAPDKWCFQQFGPHLIAVHPNDDPQVFTIDGGTNFAALLGSPPRARSVIAISDFLVLAGLTSDPQLIQWSAINDIEGWTIGTDLSDTQFFPDGGPVVGIAGGEIGFVVQDRSIRTMQFLPGDTNTIFSFSRIERQKGAMAAYGYIFTRGALFFVAEDGFYAIGLSNNPAIGANMVNDWWRLNSDPARRDQTLAFADPDNPRVLWAYHSSPSALTYDRVIIYDWSLNRWSYSTAAAQMWSPLPLAAVSLDEDTGDAGDALLDSDAPPLDSYYGGGRPVIGAIGPTGLLAFLTGSTLPATIETSEGHLTPGKRTFISEAYPLLDASSVTVAIGQRERLQNVVAWGIPRPVEVTGSSAIFSSSRLQRFRVSVSGGDTWTHAMGVQCEAQPDGEI